MQPVVGLGLHSSAVEDVGHERCGWRFGRGFASQVWPARFVFSLCIRTPACCTHEGASQDQSWWLARFVFSLCIRTPPLLIHHSYEKYENRVQRVLGLGLLVFWTWSASLERTRHFRCLIATSTLKKKAFVVSNTYTFTSRRKSGRLFIDLSLMEKKSNKYSRSFCTDISWRSKCARGMCDADPDCTRASLVQRRLSFFCFSSSSPGNWWLNRH